jgi:hypothetical protein
MSCGQVGGRPLVSVVRGRVDSVGRNAASRGVASSFGSQLADGVTSSDDASPHNPGVDAAQVKGMTRPGVHEPQRIEPVSRRELFASAVRRAADLEDCRSELDPRPGRHVFGAQIEIEVELVAGEWPPVTRSRQQRDDSSIHHGDLSPHITVTSQPAVADDALRGVQLCLAKRLALVLSRAADDEFDCADISR